MEGGPGQWQPRLLPSVFLIDLKEVVCEPLIFRLLVICFRFSGFFLLILKSFDNLEVVRDGRMHRVQ